MSLVCSALALGCGDDGKSPANTVPSAPNADDSADDSADDTLDEAGNSETSNPTTSPAATSAPDDTDPTNVSSAPQTDSTDPTATEGDTGAGSTFIVPPDGGQIGECDVFAQDCLPGQKCSAFANDGGTSWNDAKCVPVMDDPATPGDDCVSEGSGVSGIDNCDLGAYCWDTDAEGKGKCVALCKGTVDAPFCDDTDKVCAVYNMGVLNLCLDGCDPLAQDCDPSDVCVGNPSGDGFLCVLDASADEGQQHDPCEYANSCDPGLLCLDATAASECDPAASGCCEPFCDVTDPEADANCGGVGQVCNPYYEEGTAPPGFEGVGYCAIPM